MAIDKRTFRNNLQYYMSIGMSAEEAFQYMLQKHGFDASISSIPTHINRLVKTGIPFERALKIAEDVVLDNDLYSYKRELQEYKDRMNRISKLISPPSINSILGGVLTAPKGDTPSVTPPMAMAEPEQEKEVLPIAANPNGSMPALPISGMYDESAVSTDTNEPSGKVVVGPDTEVPAQSVQPVQPAQPMVKPLRRAPKPKLYVEPGVSTNKPPVVNNPSVVNTPTITSNVSAPVAAPTLSSVTSQAVRHNGGFDNYRRESVLSALRAAGGISPAEAVQRGIIPWEALNYV